MQRRLSIPTRIFLGFAVLIVLTGMLGTLSLVQHDRTAATLRLLHEGYLPLTLTLGEGKATQSVFASLLDRVKEQRDASANQAWLDAARHVRPASVQRTMHELARAERLSVSDGDRASIARMRRELETIRDLFDANDREFDALSQSMQAHDAVRIAYHLGRARGRELTVQGHYRNAVRELQDRIAVTSAEASSREQSTAYLLAILTLLSMGVGLAVTLQSQRVLRPLPRLHARVQAVARGDLSSVLEATSNDELGRLTQEFERMVSTLAARDQNLREAADKELSLLRMQEQIVGALRAGIVVVDAEGFVRTVNRSAEALFRTDRGSLGQRVERTPIGEALPTVGAILAEVRERARPVSRAGLELAGGNEKRFVDLRAAPFGGGEGPVGSILLVVDDVTEELRTKTRLLETERLAAIGRMAAHVTHEVRNPLSSIALNVEMLGDELSPGATEARALMGAIQREIDRLTAITEEYLRLARVPDPRLEPIEAEELIRGVAEFVRREMDAAGVRLVVDAPDTLPVIAIDEAQIRQALLNLLRNAREAMPGGGEIRLEAVPEADGVAIRVTDRGVGMSEEVRAHLFDLFFSTKEKGSGLGLPLTQQIVTAHGGTIHCDSEPGRGTTFHIHLPAAREAAIERSN
ncbi:MAG: ATP-binding protein [Polyangiales bacterium]